jgi:hypothetical protein
MKNQPSLTPKRSNERPPQPQGWTGKSHLKTLIIALVVWLGLFLIVLLEHGRSWAKLLPMLFIGIVVYGAYVTWKLIAENNRNNNQRY